MVLEKTLESPLDCKEVQPVHPKRDQSWVFIGRIEAYLSTATKKPLFTQNYLEIEKECRPCGSQEVPPPEQALLWVLRLGVGRTDLEFTRKGPCVRLLAALTE